MKVIRSGILAVILSIFLIQAADPPYKKGTFITEAKERFQQDRGLSTPILSFESSSETSLFHHLPVKLGEQSNVLFNILSVLNKNSTTDNVIEEKSQEQPEIVLEHFKLYDGEVHNDLGNSSTNSDKGKERISKEDEKVEELKYLTKEELEFLINAEVSKPDDNSLVNTKTPQFIPSGNGIGSSVRRVDYGVVQNVSDQEHIGEILPTNFVSQRFLKPFPRNIVTAHPRRNTVPPMIIRRRIYTRNLPFHSRILKKSFDPQRYYRPFSFPHEEYTRPFRLVEEEPNVRSEYDYSLIPPTGITEDSIHTKAISNPFEVPSLIEGSRSSYIRAPPTALQNRYRNVRKQKGLRDPITESSSWQGSWKVARRPRVIFPSDLVAFKETNQEEPDWLTADANLQDLQQSDVKDRGTEAECTEGATCEFFLTCWMTGGLLDGVCGLLRGCCQRDNSKSGRSTSQMVGTIEAPRETAKAQAAIFDLDTQCGIPNRQQAQRRIVGGDEPGFGSFPWQAYIRIGSSRCGGSLVSRRHVVTAGHCVARAMPKQVHVTLGDYVINSAAEPLPAYTFGVSSIQVHPFFKFTPQADRFDVAVLRLDRTAYHLPHIAPICLPSKGENFLGEVGVAAGWGALSPGSRLRPQTLQAVPVPVIDNRQCERWHRSKGIGVTIYDEMMCAGYKNGGRDSCQGDSGGPLMLQKQGRWFLIGIVSAGYSCAQPGQPGIYHRVAHTVEWITRAIAA